MSYSPVGLGVVAAGSFQGGITPAWPAGANRTAGNLLVCWANGMQSATFPTTPAGWSVARQENATFVSASIFYKIAAGGDAAPSFPAIANGQLFARLAEFAGAYQFGSVLDQSAVATTAAASPVTATNAAADVLPGELVIYNGTAYYSSGSGVLTPTLNDASVAGAASNSGQAVYAMGYGLPSSNASADSCSMTCATTGLTHTALAVASFKVNDLYSQPLKQPWGLPIQASIQVVSGSTYSWTLTKPAGSAATITGQGTSAVTVHPDLEGSYTLSVTATDTGGNHFTDGGTTLVTAPIQVLGAGGWKPGDAKVWNGTTFV